MERSGAREKELHLNNEVFSWDEGEISYVDTKRVFYHIISHEVKGRLNNVIHTTQRVFLSLVGPAGAGKITLLHKLSILPVFEPRYQSILFLSKPPTRMRQVE